MADQIRTPAETVEDIDLDHMDWPQAASLTAALQEAIKATASYHGAGDTLDTLALLHAKAAVREARAFPEYEREQRKLRAAKEQAA